MNETSWPEAAVMIVGLICWAVVMWGYFRD